MTERISVVTSSVHSIHVEWSQLLCNEYNRPYEYKCLPNLRRYNPTNNLLLSVLVFHCIFTCYRNVHLWQSSAVLSSSVTVCLFCFSFFNCETQPILKRK